jgi:hypothetical protein
MHNHTKESLIIPMNNAADTNKNSQVTAALALIALAAFALLTFTDAGQLHFLTKCLDAADASGGIQFPEIITFFNNLRSGLVGIALPVGTCALVAGCVLWAFGRMANRFAQALLGGGLVAALGVLLVPSLLA